jgi:hypothetical protein
VSAARADTSTDATTWAVAFALGALATWRVTHLVVNEDGPADVVLRLRRAAGSSPLGQLMDCFYCASAWVALPIALTLTRGHATTAPWRRLGASRRVISPGRVTIWLALWGAACLLEQATRSDILDEPSAHQADEPHAAPSRRRAVPGGVA